MMPRGQGENTSVEVHCIVIFSDRRRARDANVTLQRLALGGKKISKNTDVEGTCSFRWRFRGQVINPWKMVHRVEASARWEDRNRGVRFSAAPASFTRSQGARDWTEDSPLVLTLGRELQREPGVTFTRSGVLRSIARLPHGEELAWSVAEMSDAIQCSLPTSAVCLAGRVMGQAIWLKGQRTWWETAWGTERLTLGPLLDKQQVRAAIEGALTPGYYQRLRRSFLLLRNDASHGIDTPITMNEARTCGDLARQLIEAWWGPEARPT